MTIATDRMIRGEALDRRLRDLSHAAYMNGHPVTAETLEEAADALEGLEVEYDGEAGLTAVDLLDYLKDRDESLKSTAAALRDIRKNYLTLAAVLEKLTDLGDLPDDIDRDLDDAIYTAEGGS